MNTRHPFDQRLADWLEDGPADAPDQILETVLAALPSIPQRRAALRVPWRTSSMNGYTRMLAGIAAVVAIAVGVLILRPGPSSSRIGAGQSVSPAPSASASSVPTPEALASVPIGWKTYFSSRFAYAIAHPADWPVTPATADFPDPVFPDKDSTEHDVFGGPSTNGRMLFVSSVPLKADKTPADWLVQLDNTNANHACQLSMARTVTVGGASAREEEMVCMGTDHIVEVVMANQSRLFQINLFQSVAVTDADRATLAGFLASFQFGG